MFEDDIIKNTYDDGQGYPILSDEEINAGLVFPVVAETLLGTSGTYIMLTLILLAVMSTGSGQASDYCHNNYAPYPTITGDSYCLHRDLRHLPAIHSAFQEICKGKSLLAV